MNEMSHQIPTPLPTTLPHTTCHFALVDSDSNTDVVFKLKTNLKLDSYFKLLSLNLFYKLIKYSIYL